ncbi:hypothetical protein [Rudaeicoccus suwonensis]|uniref:aggregation-promoting factor C-terminal-like domain-containing protein n=1 Tax=Rudaeicoccus suwonensis TaxID=657409 RepID=UPI001FED0B7E|nr:hypothetical protein [Rudaeicoccus suwonensis]
MSVSAAGYASAASALSGPASADLQLRGQADGLDAVNAGNSAVYANGDSQSQAAAQAVAARNAANGKSKGALASLAAQARALQAQANGSAASAREAAAAQSDSSSSSSGSGSGSGGGTTVTTFSGSPQAIAAAMLSSFGWGQNQMGCLVSLWNRESGWNASAENASSGAYGIPQALPGSKMASAGADWRTNPATQIKWGLGYIASRYGSPCGAWGHSQATGWY